MASLGAGVKKGNPAQTGGEGGEIKLNPALLCLENTSGGGEEIIAGLMGRIHGRELTVGAGGDA